VLAVENVSMSFGGVKALTDVTLQVQPGEVVGVIGPNGSGKSTLINVITGFYRPTAGRVRLDDDTLSGSTPETIRSRGVVRTFQNLRLVQEMSVLDNAIAGLYLKEAGRGGLTLSWLGDFVGSPGARRRSRECEHAARAALDQVGLGDKIHARVSALSYADQKRLELARAIALRPRVLVLDEPTAGMSVEEADELIRMVVRLVASDSDSDSDSEHMSLFLVEHRLELVLEVSDRAVVMDGGCVVADGDPGAVAVDPEVRRIYVGGE
jgi:branched-chain amino acid transport system ATP-binding protein